MDSITGRVFNVLSWVTAVFAIIPLIPLVPELKNIPILAKPKPATSDVQQRVDKLCQLMDIKKKVTVKLVDGWRNAKAQDTSILLGRPLLDNFADASINGVFAHELAHIKKEHARRTILKIIIPSLFFAAYSLYFFNVKSIPLRPNLFIFCILLLLMFVVLLRATSWPQEYEADSVGAKCVSVDTMIITLLELAKLKNTNVEQDTYGHPSISRRIANLRRA